MAPQYTQEAYDAKLAALEDAKARLSKAYLALGESAEADSNTWHDNPAFDAANEEIRQAQASLRAIEQDLRDAKVVNKPNSSIIGVGHTVELRDSAGHIETYLLAGHSVHRNAKDHVMQISTESPLGQALLGRTVGDHVSYVGPTGRTISYEILVVS